MSYDYNNLVQTIWLHRTKAYSLSSPSSSQSTPEECGKITNFESLEKSVETFNTFSTVCPMTPLLWMQYAQDTLLVMKHSCGNTNEEMNIDMLTCYETACGVLELGIEEFPLCSLLRLMHLDLRCATAQITISTDSSHETIMSQSAIINEIFDQILDCLGKGTTQDEFIIVGMYNTYLTFLGKMMMSCSDESHQDLRKLFRESIIRVFLSRSEMPWKSGNDTLIEEMRLYDEKFQPMFTNKEKSEVEQNKRYANSGDLVTSLHSMEEDIQIAMSQEGILPAQTPVDIDTLVSFWSTQDVKDGKKLNGADESQADKSTTAATMHDWETILGPNFLGATYLMGCGLYATATSFIKYSQRIIQQIKITEKERSKAASEEERDYHTSSIASLYKLIIATYERGVSECCTVEDLWEKYLNHLSYLLHQKGEIQTASNIDLLKKMSDVAERSVRNCPYSIKLYSYQMRIVEFEASFGKRIFDPDAVMKIVQASIQSGFLANQESHLSIYQSALSLVKNRILSIISSQSSPYEYDEHEPMIPKKKIKGQDVAEVAGASIMRYKESLDEELEEDTQDLIEDLREMFDGMEQSLRKKYPNWPAGHAALLLERAEVEGYILEPILRSFNDDDRNQAVIESSEAIKFYEKVVRMQHIPTHPSWFRKYICFVWSDAAVFGSSAPKSPGMIASKIRYVRNLYQRAMVSVKKEGAQLEGHEICSPLRNLSEEFLEFERRYGSEKSIGIANKLVEERLLPLDSNMDQPSQESLKRKRPEEIVVSDEVELRSKKQRLGTDNEDEITKDIKNAGDPASEGDMKSNESLNKKTNLKVPKDNVPKVRLGKLDFPAHPYTIRVSNLSEITEDMDLVDLFTKCGPIVHSRIVREKLGKQKGKAKSRGFGLVQFEERDSVESALKLDGEVGLHDRLVKVDRSNQPAVSKVPPGMHRVVPKGNGKKTKANLKRKERRMKMKTPDDKSHMEVDDGSEDNQPKDKAEDKADHLPEDNTQKKSTTNHDSSVLMFQPRGLRR